MRKKANLFLAAGALSLGLLGVASPALAATPHSSANIAIASRGQSAAKPADDAHHTCDEWRFPYCDDPTFDVDMQVPGYDIHIDLSDRCKKAGHPSGSHVILMSRNYQGPNGHRWTHGAYRCL
jgi:hypothetical protein